MRGADRAYMPWNQLAVTNGTRVYERVTLDNAVGCCWHLVASNGCAGALTILTTNFDNTLPLAFDADSTTYCNQLASLNFAMPANGMHVNAFTFNSQVTSMARYVLINFVPSASGNLTLYVSVRRFTAV